MKAKLHTSDFLENFINKELEFHIPELFFLEGEFCNDEEQINYGKIYGRIDGKYLCKNDFEEFDLYDYAETNPSKFSYITQRELEEKKWK